MAQPFKQFLTDLSTDASLREAFFADALTIGREAGLNDDQIKAIVRSDVDEIQALLIDEAIKARSGDTPADPQAKPGTAKPMVTIDN